MTTTQQPMSNRERYWKDREAAVKQAGMRPATQTVGSLTVTAQPGPTDPGYELQSDGRLQVCFMDEEAGTTYTVYGPADQLQVLVDFLDAIYQADDQIASAVRDEVQKWNKIRSQEYEPDNQPSRT